MKEAAGEANLTVVAIILIAVVVAVATPLVNNLMSTSRQKACCTDVGGVIEGKFCKKVKGDEFETIELKDMYSKRGKKCREFSPRVS